MYVQLHLFLEVIRAPPKNQVRLVGLCAVFSAVMQKALKVGAGSIFNHNNSQLMLLYTVR